MHSSYKIPSSPSFIPLLSFFAKLYYTDYTESIQNSYYKEYHTRAKITAYAIFFPTLLVHIPYIYVYSNTIIYKMKPCIRLTICISYNHQYNVPYTYFFLGREALFLIFFDLAKIITFFFISMQTIVMR